jgi:hypothetical protein
MPQSFEDIGGGKHALIVTMDGGSGGGGPLSVGGTYNATPPTVADGTSAPLQLSDHGDLKVVITDGDGNIEAANPNGRASQTGSTPVAIDSEAFALLGNLSTGVPGQVYNGTAYNPQREISNALNSTGTGLAAAGLVAQLDDTAPNAVTENQFGAVRMAPNRSVLVTKDASPTNYWQYAAAAGGLANTTTAVPIAPAAGAGLRNYLSGLQLSASALGAATEVAIRDGAGGTVLWRGYVGTDGISGVQGVTFDKPLKGTANTLMEAVTLTATVTGGVYVNAQGFVAP